MLSQSLEAFKLNQDVFFREKASLEQETTGGIYCLCSNVSPDLAEHSGLKISFLIKPVEFFKENPSSNNCPGMGRGDISQHIPILSEARTAGPATSCAFIFITLGAIPSPFGK